MISGRLSIAMLKFKFVVLLSMLFGSDALFGQVDFIPVPLAFPQIAVGGDADGQNYTTLVQVINNNSASITGRLTLFSDSGSALAVLFDGQGPQSRLDITLEPGEARQIQLTLNGTITPAWMQISYSPNDALTSVILQFRSGTTLLSEVGVDAAFNTIGATDLAAETDAALNTGIAIANPSSATAFVLATLWNPNSGTQVGTVITLPPNGHIARFLTELFPTAQDISQIRAKISLDSCLAASCSVAGGNGFIATALRLNGDQFTTIPVAERLQNGERIRILPQVAFGGPATGINMKTVLYFTTNISSGVFGTAQIFDNDGNPLPASADGNPPSSTINITVLGNRVSRVVLTGDQTLRSGWIRLTLSGNVALSASAVFQTFSGSNLVAEASVLESPPLKNGLIYLKTQSGAANVGVAVANSQSSSNTIAIDLFDRQGFVIGNRSITLPPNGHLAQFVTELFPQLNSVADFDGALALRSTTDFSALALRLTNDKIATLPVSDNGMYRPSITGLRIVSTQRSPGQVSFDVDLRDFDSDVATSSSRSVSMDVFLDFGNSVFDSGLVSVDGAGIIDQPTGSLRGTFQSRFTGIPSGQPAALFVRIVDSAGNTSNVVAFDFRF